MIDNMIPYQLAITEQNMKVLVFESEYKSQTDLSVTEEHIIKLLQNRNITHGIDWEAIKCLVHTPEILQFPLIIARGDVPGWC